jgi:uncharacterized membrane protein (DUF2068 family)
MANAHVSSTPIKQVPPPSPSAAAAAEARGHLGFRLIIGYKFAKAALMFCVALWLTIAPGEAYRTLDFLARELVEGGAAFARLGNWIHAHLSNNIVLRGAVLAWLDCVSSAVEGFLLLSGRTWAQWIVIVGLAGLLPFEILSIGHHPRVGKFLVLAANVAIVAYLARGQILKARTHRGLGRMDE